MKLLVTAKSINPDMHDIKVNLEIPRKCPRCGAGYIFSPLSTHFIDHENPKLDRVSFSLFFCPNCGDCFIATHTLDPFSRSVDSFLREIFPTSSSVSSFSEQLTALSPDFVRIYNQSEKAESAGLNEICGIGYRKALEFLVKDFAIHRNPEDEDSIKAQPLAACIKNYIPEEPIKSLATKSAWLGNDQTHYVRKHQDRDIGDLKNFIQAAVYFISMTLVAEDAANM